MTAQYCQRWDLNPHQTVALEASSVGCDPVVNIATVPVSTSTSMVVHRRMLGKTRDINRENRHVLDQLMTPA